MSKLRVKITTKGTKENPSKIITLEGIEYSDQRNKGMFQTYKMVKQNES